MTIIMNFMVIESFEQWTSMNPLLLEFILMFIPLVFFSIILNKLTGPELSLIAAISTTIIFGSAFVCLLQVDDPWDFSPLTLMRPLTSSLEHSAFIFTIAYLMMDLPWCIFGYPNETSWTRIQYCCHHVLCAVTLVAQILSGKWGRLGLLMCGSEFTGILLNGREFINKKKYPTMRFIADIAFVLAFFGVRICFLFPINLRALYYMGLHGMWSDLLVINIGCLVIGCFMHIYWTGQIVREIYYTVFGQNLKDIKDEERNHNKKID